MGVRTQLSGALFLESALRLRRVCGLGLTGSVEGSTFGHSDLLVGVSYRL
jgi:hypothetical protein